MCVGRVSGKWVKRLGGGGDREWMRLDVEEGGEPAPVLNIAAGTDNSSIS